MFDFNLNNPYGFSIAFIPALFNLAIVFYTFWKLPENRLTNVFVLLTLALAFWQVNDAITRISPTAQITDEWDNIFCIAWIFVGPLCLHFALIYTSILKQEQSRTAFILLYFPALIFVLLYQANIYPHNYIHDNFWGWVNSHEGHWIDIIQVYWISALVLSSAVLISYHAFSIRKDKLLKKQTIFIAIGFAVPTIAGLLGQTILPIILNRPAIPFASTFMSFFSVAAVISLSRYRLFNAVDMVTDIRLIEEMPFMIFSITEKNRLSFINKFAADALEINIQELGHQPADKLLKFSSSAEKELFFESCAKTLSGATINNFETSFITSKGKIVVLVSSRPIVNNHKVEGVLVAGRDITSLIQINELMAYNEMLLSDAQEISHIGSWEWNMKDDSVVWSNELYRIYGFEPGENNFDFNQVVEMMHPEDIQVAREIIMTSYNTHESFSFFARVIRKDETMITIHAIGKVVTGELNDVVKFSGTIQDITERKVQEEILQSQNVELKKINNELDKFVYSVSHDLRAPLLSMKGIVEITNEMTKEEDTVAHMGMLKKSISRLDKFIEDILDYSLNARGKIKVSPIDFNELMKEITADLKYMASEKKVVDIQYSVESEGLFHTDYGRISIILNNLISNAIRYHNPLVEKSYVKISVHSNAIRALIKVEDNGLGISQANHEKIFEMFYRISSNSNGSGLGLYIVKEAISKLNGQIEIDSLPGSGTTFTLEIPNLLFQ